MAATIRVSPLQASGRDARALDRCLDAAVARSLWPASISTSAIKTLIRQRMLPSVVHPQRTAWALRSGSRMIGTAVLEPLPWDSKLYRIGIARLELIFASSSRDEQHAAILSLLTHLKRLCHRQRIIHLACRVGYADFGVAQALEEGGFRYTDTTVTLTRPTGEQLATLHTHTIDPATNEDIPTLQRIAAGAFTNGRVDHDPRLPERTNRELYRQWIANACRGRSDVVLVARAGGAVAGFICCNADHQAAKGNATIGFIDLLAVAPTRQGKGIGRSLLRAALAWLDSRVTLVEIRTQLSNNVSILLYQQEGFQMISSGIALPSGHAFHGWFTLRAS